MNTEIVNKLRQVFRNIMPVEATTTRDILVQLASVVIANKPLQIKHIMYAKCRVIHEKIQYLHKSIRL